jgi:hypothetical protein
MLQAHRSGTLGSDLLKKCEIVPLAHAEATGNQFPARFFRQKASKERPTFLGSVSFLPQWQ